LVWIVMRPSSVDSVPLVFVTGKTMETVEFPVRTRRPNERRLDFDARGIVGGVRNGRGFEHTVSVLKEIRSNAAVYLICGRARVSG